MVGAQSWLEELPRHLALEASRSFGGLGTATHAGWGASKPLGTGADSSSITQKRGPHCGPGLSGHAFGDRSRTVSAIIYYKGAFVLHMLRMMMREQESPSPDAAFMALMQDFARTYTGLSPSTADFQKVAERHIVPMMNATGDGKLDWFFHQWVDGTEIPRLVNDLKVEKQGEEYHVTGSIHQEGVSDTFRTLVPVYAELVKGAPLRFSIVPLIGRTPRELDLHVKAPQKLKKITLNYHHEVLSRD